MVLKVTVLTGGRYLLPPWSSPPDATDAAPVGWAADGATGGGAAAGTEGGRLDGAAAWAAAGAAIVAAALPGAPAPPKRSRRILRTALLATSPLPLPLPSPLPLVPPSPPRASPPSEEGGPGARASEATLRSTSAMSSGLRVRSATMASREGSGAAAEAAAEAADGAAAAGGPSAPPSPSPSPPFRSSAPAPVPAPAPASSSSCRIAGFPARFEALPLSAMAFQSRPELDSRARLDVDVGWYRYVVSI